jgi:arginyl-tRNA synthetase
MKTRIAELLFKALPEKVLSKQEILSLIEVPPDEKLGDLAFPCFKLAAKLKKKPNEIAVELKQGLPENNLIERTETIGPYLNFFLNYSTVALHLVPEILRKEKSFGSNDSGKGKKVMVEFSAPNTNKPLHLGHLRNDSLGMAVSNLFEANGWKVIRANLYSNRGIHICKSLLAYLKWGKGIEPN